MKTVVSHPLCNEGMEKLHSLSEVYIANNASAMNYIEELQDADAVILRLSTMRSEAIAACPNLKVIGRTGVGYDNVDEQVATAAGIPIVLTPGVNGRSVAEHTIALMFACAKNIVEAQVETKNGNFAAVRNQNKAFDLEGKTIGIIGLGAIGKQVATICRALGMNVLAYDPMLTKELIEAESCTYYANYEAMLLDCDVVTIHVPLTEQTRDMISMKQMKLMKDTAVLIHCSRGGIINEKDLFEALDTGVIAAAGIDVFEEEPPNINNPLLHAKNITYSPHSAAQTRECVIKMADMCIEGCMAVVRGERWPHVANKDVYQHPRWNKK